MGLGSKSLYIFLHLLSEKESVCVIPQLTMWGTTNKYMIFLSILFMFSPPTKEYQCSICSASTMVYFPGNGNSVDSTRTIKPIILCKRCIRIFQCTGDYTLFRNNFWCDHFLIAIFYWTKHVSKANLVYGKDVFYSHIFEKE